MVVARSFDLLKNHWALSILPNFYKGMVICMHGKIIVLLVILITLVTCYNNEAYIIGGFEIPQEYKYDFTCNVRTCFPDKVGEEGYYQIEVFPKNYKNYNGPALMILHGEIALEAPAQDTVFIAIGTPDPWWKVSGEIHNSVTVSSVRAIFSGAWDPNKQKCKDNISITVKIVYRKLSENKTYIKHDDHVDTMPEFPNVNQTAEFQEGVKKSLDSNGDGHVDILDFINYREKEKEKIKYDRNGDGHVDILDFINKGANASPGRINFGKKLIVWAKIKTQ